MEEDLKRFELMKAMMVDENEIKKKMVLRGFRKEDVELFLRGEKIVCLAQPPKPAAYPQPSKPPLVSCLAVNNSVPVKLKGDGIKRFLMMRNLHVSEVKIREKMLQNNFTTDEIKNFMEKYPCSIISSPNTSTLCSNINIVSDIKNVFSENKIHLFNSSIDMVSATNESDDKDDILIGFINMLISSNMSDDMIKAKMESVGIDSYDINNFLNDASERSSEASNDLANEYLHIPKDSIRRSNLRNSPSSSLSSSPYSLSRPLSVTPNLVIRSSHVSSASNSPTHSSSRTNQFHNQSISSLHSSNNHRPNTSALITRSITPTKTAPGNSRSTTPTSLSNIHSSHTSTHTNKLLRTSPHVDRILSRKFDMESVEEQKALRDAASCTLATPPSYFSKHSSSSNTRLKASMHGVPHVHISTSTHSLPLPLTVPVPLPVKTTEFHACKTSSLERIFNTADNYINTTAEAQVPATITATACNQTIQCDVNENHYSKSYFSLNKSSSQSQFAVVISETSCASPTITSTSTSTCESISSSPVPAYASDHKADSRELPDTTDSSAPDDHTCIHTTAVTAAVFPSRPNFVSKSSSYFNWFKKSPSPSPSSSPLLEKNTQESKTLRSSDNDSNDQLCLSSSICSTNDRDHDQCNPAEHHKSHGRPLQQLQSAHSTQSAHRSPLKRAESSSRMLAKRLYEMISSNSVSTRATDTTAPFNATARSPAAAVAETVEPVDASSSSSSSFGRFSGTDFNPMLSTPATYSTGTASTTAEPTATNETKMRTSPTLSVLFKIRNSPSQLSHQQHEKQLHQHHHQQEQQAVGSLEAFKMRYSPNRSPSQLIGRNTRTNNSSQTTTATDNRAQTTTATDNRAQTTTTAAITASSSVSSPVSKSMRVSSSQIEVIGVKRSSEKSKLGTLPINSAKKSSFAAVAVTTTTSTY